MSSKKIEKFNIKVVHENFSNALHEEDDVVLQYYLNSFDELNKFFNLMGTVFGFVSQDLQAKMDILAQYLNDDNISEYFTTVKQMIIYEKENNLLNKNGYVSGARTLLRLHRGLDFIRAFLKEIGELSDDDNTSHVCKGAYDRTLAQYHPFMIRQGAKLAMYTLPKRKDLFKRVCGSEEEIKLALDKLPETLNVTTIVYERVNQLYDVHDLHGLP